MTTKQNAIDLAKTARSEAANTAKRTIAAIIINWNESVEQAGFTGVFDFPTTGYTRKSQLIADLERCAAQLDDYVEPRPELATMTVEQQTREFNAALTRVLDIDEAHAEALEMNEEVNYHDAIADFSWELQIVGFKETLTAFFAVMDEALEMNAALDDEYARIERLVSGSEAEKNRFKFIAAKYIVGADTKAAHAEALKINDAYNYAYTRPGAIFQEAFFDVFDDIEREVSIDRAHTEALGMDAKFYKECA